jgi:hypothetical protein
MFKSKTSVKLLNESFLNTLPLGLDFNLQLHYYDDLGDEFYMSDSSSLKLNYDLNRQDFIQISENNDFLALKPTKAGSTLLSVTNLNQKLDISDYYLRLPSNKMNFFKNMELNLNQMDIIGLNHNYN